MPFCVSYRVELHDTQRGGVPDDAGAAVARAARRQQAASARAGGRPRAHHDTRRARRIVLQVKYYNIQGEGKGACNDTAAGSSAPRVARESK